MSMEKHEGVPLVTKPLTNEEAITLMNKEDNTLTVRILIGFDELVECGDTNRFDDFNDGILPKVLESDYYLTDVSYNPVGIDHANEGPNSIVLEVCGSLEELLAEEGEKEEEEEE